MEHSAESTIASGVRPILGRALIQGNSSFLYLGKGGFVVPGHGVRAGNSLMEGHLLHAFFFLKPGDSSFKHRTFVFVVVAFA